MHIFVNKRKLFIDVSQSRGLAYNNHNVARYAPEYDRL